MRILIISPQRTGGNVFSKWLSFELSYKWLHEPFNINNNLLLLLKYDRKNVEEIYNLINK